MNFFLLSINGNFKKYKSQVVERYWRIGGVPPDISGNYYIVEVMLGSKSDFSKREAEADIRPQKNIINSIIE